MDGNTDTKTTITGANAILKVLSEQGVEVIFVFVSVLPSIFVLFLMFINYMHSFIKVF